MNRFKMAMTALILVGIFCWTATAQAGQCETDEDCQDNSVCTIDSCDPVLGLCQFDPIDCSDGDDCTIDGCDPQNGCFNEPQCIVDEDCDDGNPATEDQCTTEGCCLSTPGMIEPYMDIKPGSCPNSFQVNKKGVLPVALIGGAAFDVAEVVVDSLRLRREGASSEVAPLRWVIEDAATPFEGELCDCHELIGDGIDDLAIKFDSREVVAALELSDIPRDTLVELQLTGELVDGTVFVATDCIRVLGTPR